MNFQTAIETLLAADKAGDLTLSFPEYVTVARLFSDPEPVHINNHADLVNFAKVDPETEAAYRRGEKISAIKALREACKADDVFVHESLTSGAPGVVGLKAAKDAVEAAFEWVKPTPPATLPFTACPYCWGNLNETTTWDRCPTNRHNHRGV